MIGVTLVGMVVCRSLVCSAVGVALIGMMVHLCLGMVVAGAFLAHTITSFGFGCRHC